MRAKSASFATLSAGGATPHAGTVPASAAPA
jgi:hypothetical protein